MPRCCDPLRAFASLKPNRAAMMDSSLYERAINYFSRNGVPLHSCRFAAVNIFDYTVTREAR